jgi:DHA2 family multidrug resistance protein
MIKAFIEDPPFLRRTRHTRIDYIGFSLMTLWLGTMQIILDKGQEADWLAAPWLRYCTVISVLALIFFIIRELRTAEPIVHLTVFANRNFAVGTIVILVVGAVLYSTTAMLPLFLQTLMGYPALQSGLTVSPRGLGSFASMILVGRIIGLIDDRALMACGFGILAVSMHMLAKISTDISMMSVIWPNIINGFAMGFIFVPLTTATMGMLPQAEISNATGIYNLMRNLGGGLGISVATMLLERGAQVHQAAMISHMTAFDPAYTTRLHALAGALSSRVGHAQSLMAAGGIMYGTLLRQAQVWVYVDNFNWLSLLCLLCIPLVFLFRKVRYGGKPIAAH